MGRSTYPPANTAAWQDLSFLSTSISIPLFQVAMTICFNMPPPMGGLHMWGIQKYRGSGPGCNAHTLDHLIRHGCCGFQMTLMVITFHFKHSSLEHCHLSKSRTDSQLHNSCLHAVSLTLHHCVQLLAGHQVMNATDNTTVVSSSCFI